RSMGTSPALRGKGPGTLRTAARRRDFFAALSVRRARPRQVEDAARDERGPAGLVARAESAAGVAVEVLVEEDELLEVRIGGVAQVVAVAGTAALGVGQEDRREPPRELARDEVERQEASRSRRALDLQGVAVEVVVALERL